MSICPRTHEKVEETRGAKSATPHQKCEHTCTSTGRRKTGEGETDGRKGKERERKGREGGHKRRERGGKGMEKAAQARQNHLPTNAHFVN